MTWHIANIHKVCSLVGAVIVVGVVVVAIIVVALRKSVRKTHCPSCPVFPVSFAMFAIAGLPEFW